jgi:type I restriction enzyme R subunit
VKINHKQLNELGENFEKTTNGYIDFLLLDEKGFPFIVLEAKAEDKNPLFGKEQARRYAQAQGCRFVILSNGNLHYFWDLERGDPHVISRFPSLKTIKGYENFKPDKNRLIEEIVNEDYITLTQKPDYKDDPSYRNEETRQEFIVKNKLRFLRKYQLLAVKSVQNAVKKGGTGSFLKWQPAQEKLLSRQRLLSCFYVRVMPEEYCFWWIVLNLKTRHIRRSGSI